MQSCQTRHDSRHESGATAELAQPCLQPVTCECAAQRDIDLRSADTRSEDARLSRNVSAVAPGAEAAPRDL